MHAALDAIESREAGSRSSPSIGCSPTASSPAGGAALFELLRSKDHERFRDVQALVKELPAYDLEPALGAA